MSSETEQRFQQRAEAADAFAAMKLDQIPMTPAKAADADAAALKPSP